MKRSDRILPLEIIGMIALELIAQDANGTAATLQRTSQEMHDLITPLLYHKVALNSSTAIHRFFGMFNIPELREWKNYFGKAPTGNDMSLSRRAAGRMRLRLGSLHHLRLNQGFEELPSDWQNIAYYGMDIADALLFPSLRTLSLGPPLLQYLEEGSAQSMLALRTLACSAKPAILCLKGVDTPHGHRNFLCSGAFQAKIDALSLAASATVMHAPGAFRFLPVQRDLYLGFRGAFSTVSSEETRWYVEIIMTRFNDLFFGYTTRQSSNKTLPILHIGTTFMAFPTEVEAAVRDELLKWKSKCADDGERKRKAETCGRIKFLPPGLDGFRCPGCDGPL